MTGPVRLFLFSPILHSFLQQRPQKLAEQFVRSSIPVTFVEPSGFREHFGGRRHGLVALLRRSLRYHMGMAADPAREKVSSVDLAIPVGSPVVPRPVVSGSAGLEIVSLPFVVPSNLVDSERLELVNSRVFRAAILKEILPRRNPGERSVVFVQNPFLGAVLRQDDADAIYYDCIDDISLYAGRASIDRFQGYERRLIGMSKAVFVTSSVLEREVRESGLARRIIRVPNGVESSWLDRETVVRGGPAPLRDVRSPIAGYVGAMREWFDEELILHAARSMPAVTFVLVGPVEHHGRMSRLQSVPNIILTGRIPHEEVPQYLARFDVGLIPFRPGGVAERTNPVKLYEYFAFGKPVVATPMSELREFERVGLAYLGESGAAFVEALRAGLGERDDARRRARVQVARENTWEQAASRILKTISETIDA